MTTRPNELAESVDLERVVELDRRHVWHPYTQMQDYLQGAPPLVIERAEGSRVFTSDGRGFIDGTSSWWVALLGHRHPRLVAALERQAKELCHVSFGGSQTHAPAALLAAELCAVAPPGLTRVFYSDNGSTAVEAALKLCLKYWHQNGRPQRTRVLALDHAFHGETLGVTALLGVEVFRRPYAGALMDCVHVPTDEAGFERAFDRIEQELRAHSDEIAACFVEPLLQGAGGMRLYSSEYLRRLRELTRELDVFLVIDEVFTGYGRCGPMWACELAGVVPDLLCTAKGFTGGILPMAATLTTERVFEGFFGDVSRAFHYGHTYAGHPLGAAVAREVLEVYRDEQILQGIVPKARKIERAFAALGELPNVHQARSLGMMGAVNLKASEGGQGYLGQLGWRVSELARARGVLLRPLGEVVYVAPPVNIPDADLDELLEAVREAVIKVVIGKC